MKLSLIKLQTQTKHKIMSKQNQQTKENIQTGAKEEVNPLISTQNPSFQVQKQAPKDFELAIEELAKIENISFSTSFWTLLAIRSEKSYFVGTFDHGFKVIEEGEEVFYSNNTQIMIDAHYYKPLGCYFFIRMGVLYRKDIDNKPAYSPLDIKPGSMPKKSLRSSNLNKRLFLGNKAGGLSVVDPENKKVCFVIKSKKTHYLTFEIFGKKENRLLCVDQGGLIVLININFELSKVLSLTTFPVELNQNKDYIPSSLSISPNNNYACFAHRSGGHSVMLFKIGLNSLELIKEIKNTQGRYSPQMSLGCLGCLGERILFLHLDYYFGQHLARVYQFDAESGEFKELEEKRTNNKEKYSISVERLDDSGVLYYSGNQGKVMKMRIAY